MAALLKNNPAAWLEQQWPTDEVGRFSAVEAAFSGGLDSAVLLHLLWRVARTDGRPLSAVHVRHNISPNTEQWAAFCRRVCADYGIPLREESVCVNPEGSGWEAAARRERYACFADSAAAVTALAHHADDQSETVLLALLRGGGLRSVAAMPERRLVAGRVLWRPLLPFSRAELAAYAAEHGLAWVEDESNADVQLLRNRLRRDVMPLLADAVPNMNRQLAASLRHLQRDLALLGEYAEADAAAVYDGQGRFRLSACLRLSPLRRQEQLCGFARRHGLGLPSTASVERFDEILAGGAVQARWTLPQGEAAVYGDCLFAVAAGRRVAADVCSGYLKAVWTAASCGIPSEQAAAGAGYWRAARADDCLPLPDGGRKRLACLLREQRVPPFLRDVWPVWADCADDVCLAAANLPLACGVAGVLPHFPVLEMWRGCRETVV